MEVIIVNQTLTNSPIINNLKEFYKIKFSNNNLDNCIFFPKFKTAFKILYENDIKNFHVYNDILPISEEDLRIVIELKKFSSVYQKRVVIVVSKDMNDQMLQNLEGLQQCLLKHRICISLLPILSTRVSHFLNNLKEKHRLLSIAQENYKKIMENGHDEDYISNVLKKYLEIDESECALIFDTLGCVKNIVDASLNDLEECGLDRATAKRIFEFFN